MTGLGVSWLPIHKANAFIEKHHRHHKPARGCVISLGCWWLAWDVHGPLDGRLVGVAVVGRPVARLWAPDKSGRLEVTRLCTDGTENACSRLYSAAHRVAQVLWLGLVTYTLPDEGGASLRASGARDDGLAGGGAWSRDARPREDLAPTDIKQRWLWEA